MDPLFPPLPEDLTSLTDEQIAAEIEARTTTVLAIRDGDEEVIGERTADEIVAALTEAVDQLDALRTVAADREVAAETLSAQVADLAAQALGEEAGPENEEEAGAEEGNGEDETTETETETETQTEGETETAAETETEEVAEVEPVAATAGRGIPARRVVARPARRPQKQERRSLITAAGDVPGVTAGTELDRDGLANAFIARMRSLRGGGSGDVQVATVHANFTEDRFLRSRAAAEDNTRKIAEAVGPEALVASGGICNPVEIYYGQDTVGTTARPVRDALANFGADRAGIRYAPPLGLADITGGIGVITEDEAEAGGSPATKDCLRVDCPTFQEVIVSSVYQCLEFDNLNSRSYPEYVAQAIALTNQAHARLAETNLLDAISAFTTHTTQATWGGAIGTATTALVRAAAAYRSRHRTDPNMRLDVLAPQWLGDELVVDLVSAQFDRFSKDRAGLVAFLQQVANINITFYLDQETGTSQVFGAQSAAALLTWPTNAMLYMWPTGTMLFLDGGSLDLGIVRDSTLNETNDYRIFSETFEEVAFIGNEALRIQLTSVCPTGNTGGLQATLTC